MWNLAAPPGFVGLDENRLMRFYRRHLPHWRQEGVTYFVTFRLADALPQSKLRELAALRDEWQRNVGRSTAPSGIGKGRSTAPSYDEDFARATMERMERWLDEGSGSCVLREPGVAQALERCLRHDDAKRFDLFAFVIMPNHVHLLCRPYSDATFPLEKLQQAWKSFSARSINRLLRTSGMLWQEEAFDRIVRDEEHLFRCVQYIGSNARRAGLQIDDCPRYVRADWQRAGWGFQD